MKFKVGDKVRLKIEKRKKIEADLGRKLPDEIFNVVGEIFERFEGKNPEYGVEFSLASKHIWSETNFFEDELKKAGREEIIYG